MLASTLQPWRQWSHSYKICPKSAVYFRAVCARGVCDCLFCSVPLQCVGGMLASVLWLLCRDSMIADLCALHVGSAGAYAEGTVSFRVL